MPACPRLLTGSLDTVGAENTIATKDIGLSMSYMPKTDANLNGAATSPEAPRGRVWGNRPRLVIDIILALSFLALMSVNLTGLLIHEWWGVALIVLVIVHLLSQWDWTISSSRTFFSRLTQRIR